MIPPSIVVVRIGRVVLPLPVFLLWPLLAALLPLALVVLPLIPIGGIGPGERLRWPVMAWAVLGSLRGLRIDVRQSSGKALALRCY
jgi:hypothetical protein